MALGIQRSFSSAPSTDAGGTLEAAFATTSTPTSLRIFEHDVAVDPSTGNVQITATDVGLPVHGRVLGITRIFDAQERHMHGASLRAHPNADSKPRLFGNWRLDREADVSDAWKNTIDEIRIASGIVQAEFAAALPVFHRNVRRATAVREALAAYGIPRIMMERLGSQALAGDHVLRTRCGPFRVASGRFTPESLVDPEIVDLAVVDPGEGRGWRFSSSLRYDRRRGARRFLGPGTLCVADTDALGHTIQLLARPDAGEAVRRYELVDDSDRVIELHTDATFEEPDGLLPAGTIQRNLVSAVNDQSHDAPAPIRYGYDELGRLTAVTFDGTDRAFRYHYDDGRFPWALTGIENALGHVTRFEYEEDLDDLDERLIPRLKLLRIVDPEQVARTYRYFVGQRRTEVEIRHGAFTDRTVVFGYMQDAQTSKRYRTSCEVVTQRGYTLDEAGDVQDLSATRTLRLIERTEYTRDGRVNVSARRDASGAATAFTYDDYNQVRSIREPTGRVTFNTCDVPELPTPQDPCRFDLIQIDVEEIVRSVEPDGSFLDVPSVIRVTKEYARYDESSSPFELDQRLSTHRIGRTIDSRGHVWTYDYDDLATHGALAPSSTTTPLGFVTRFEYDERGACTRMVDAENQEFNYEFDRHGRLRRYTDANGGTILLRYAARTPWLESVEDALGHVSRVERNATGWVERVVDRVGSSEHATYYANGRLRSVVRQRAIVSAEGDAGAPVFEVLETSFEYSPLGACTAIRSPDGAVLRASYDEAGRLSRIHGETAGAYERRFAYDSRARLAGVVGRSGRVTRYFYDGGGRLSEAWAPAWNDINAQVQGKRTRYLRDLTGRVLTQTDSELGMQHFAYDAAGKLVYRRDPGGFDLHFKYDSDGRLVSTSSSDGAVSLVLVLDGLGRTTTLEDSAAFDGSSAWSYTYESVEQPIARDHLFSRTNDSIGVVSLWRYDARGKATSLEHMSSAGDVLLAQQARYRADELLGAVLGTNALTFAYDEIKQLVFDGPPDMWSAYDEAGNRRFRTPAEGEPVPYPETTFEHDLEGNVALVVAADRMVDVRYDANGRLRRLSDAEQTVELGYDDEGKLVRRVATELATSDTSVREISYLLSKPVVVRENGQIVRILTWDPHGQLLRVRDSRMAAAAPYERSVFVLENILGNAVVLVDANEVVTASVEYDAWGNRLAEQGSPAVSDLSGWRSGLDEPMVGAILFGQRWYLPGAGRWMSEEPLTAFDGARHRALSNLYAYALNDPINFVDRSGLQEEWRHPPYRRPPAAPSAQAALPQTPEALNWGFDATILPGFYVGARSGRNPDGRTYFTLRYGLGASVPSQSLRLGRGSSPGWTPGVGGFGFGAFGEGGLSLGMVGITGAMDYGTNLVPGMFRSWGEQQLVEFARPYASQGISEPSLRLPLTDQGIDWVKLFGFGMSVRAGWEVTYIDW